MDNPYNTGREKGSSVLGPTLTFKGELKADEDLLIRGRIEGSIEHSSNLKIGKEGHIAAEVRAEYIEVHGEVDGNLTGSKSVVVKDTANVSGNIFSPTVSLHEGAKFNGSIDMSGKSRPASKSPEKPAKQADKAPGEPTSAGEPSSDAAADVDEKKPRTASKRKADAA
jgi:cytoskeletal protein CcmA (bactofilin family)